MKKLLCLTTALCLGALSAQAQGWGYVPQNAQRPTYRVPAQSQTQQQYRTAAPVQQQAAPVYTAPAQAQPATVSNFGIQTSSSYMPANQKYAISNPMYMLGAGHIMGNIAYQYLISPKDKDTYKPKEEGWGWDLDFAVGLTDRLSLSANLGYDYSWMNKTISHAKQWGGTIGMQYNLVNTSVFDMHAGVDLTYFKILSREYYDKFNGSATFVEPYIQMGTTINNMFTPYFRLGYQSLFFSKDDLIKEGYVATPGLYFQPIPQLGIDLNMTTAEGVDADWELRFDIYPVENISIGLSGYLTSPNDARQDIFGFGTNFKFVF